MVSQPEKITQTTKARKYEIMLRLNFEFRPKAEERGKTTAIQAAGKEKTLCARGCKAYTLCRHETTLSSPEVFHAHTHTARVVNTE